MLKSYNISFVIISKIDENPFSKGIQNKDNIMTDIYNCNEINKINNNDYILSYFKKLLSEEKYSLLSSIIINKNRLLFDISNYPDDLTNECIKKNKDIIDEIIACDKNDERWC